MGINCVPLAADLFCYEEYFFDQMVRMIYPTELQINKTKLTCLILKHILNLTLSITNGTVSF